jgi:hypothetical protein
VATGQGVQRLEGGVDDIKDMMQRMLMQGASASAESRTGILVYKASDIKIIGDHIAEGGNSHVFKATYPDSLEEIAYKRCIALKLLR